jgi:hypothetical protein
MNGPPLRESDGRTHYKEERDERDRPHTAGSLRHIRPALHPLGVFCKDAAFPGGAADAWLEPRDSMQRIPASSSVMAGLALSLAAIAGTPAQAAVQRQLQTTPTTVAVYASVLHHINPQMPQWQSRDLARRVLVNAERWRLDANMLVAIVTVESRWHTHAVSRAGAIGLGQLMPGTAARLGVDPRNPGENISGAARYLSGLMRRFGSNHFSLVFAAYNAGPKAVTEYGGIPPYGETEHYVVSVMNAWEHLSKTVRVPSEALAYARAPDIDYWLDGSIR